MIGVEVRFLAGRFHANGWHHAHNEGIPEWPPSPWRVLRSLVSAAYAEDLLASEVEPLIEKLRCLPSYRLPLAVDAHTRHYMPDTDDANHTRAKVFDSFVAVEGGATAPEPVTMAWPVELNGSERTLLARLLRRISYLGRAESWAELTLVDVQDGSWDCWPDETASTSNATSLLALSSADELAAWAEQQPKPSRKNVRDVPRGMWDVLTFDGQRYRDEGWTDVPGTRRARYVFARPLFRRAAVPRPAMRAVAPATVARFAIRSAVLPRLHEAVAIGERLRIAAMSVSRRISGDARPVFSGHVQGGNSDHGHAMYLAISEDPRNAGFIDHLVISAKCGFEGEDVITLQTIRKLWGHGGHDLELILLGIGRPADYGGTTTPRSSILARGTTWESVTPFVPTRHPKLVRGVEVEGIEDQLRRACVHLLGIEPRAVTPFGRREDWSTFRRRRLGGGGRRGPDRAYGARLVFDQEIEGPIALGYGCHFGLGLFQSVDV